MKSFGLVVLILIMFSGAGTYAHEGKKHQKHKKEQTVDSVQHSKEAVKDTAIINPSVPHHDETTETEGPYVLNVSHEIFEHLHNKIVHFALSLSIVAFFFTLINFKWKSFDTAIKILVAISALSALLAVFTGLNQAGAFRGDPKEWVVDLHEKLGIASAVLIWLWAAFLLIKPLKKYAWIAGLIVFIIISITGFYGGIAAH